MLIFQDVYFPAAGEDRRLHIWLPDSYYYSFERYPVMYMFDGHNLFQDEAATYGRSWRMGTFLSEWDKAMIIVGIECSHHDNDRLFEYSPYRWRRRVMHREPMGDATMQWICDTVKPLIDHEFRTWPHREATGIGGSSLGGLMSLYAVLHYNQVFSKAACVSTGVFRNMSALNKELEKADLNADTRIYLSWGEHEAGRAPHGGSLETDTREARGTLKYIRALQDKGVQTCHFFQKDGWHNEESWEKQVTVFMNWLWCSRG